MSEKIRVIAIDDEKLAIDVIKEYLKKADKVELIAECRNGFDGLKTISELNPDIVFLDIQMPKINGFEMLELIDDPPVIVFTTAFDQYALKAFEVNATDYLLKPFSESRFLEALEKAKKLLKEKNKADEKIESLEKYNENNSECIERIVVKNGQKIIIIPVDDVDYIEAQDDYVMLHSSKGKFLKQKTMKYFDEHLDANNFMRVHRSYIVKINSIQQIELFEKESYKIILKDGKNIPVSKSGYSKLKEIFN
ncbi:MAG: LytTR family transcriptional regulator DNA-binding domain-containing protein [Bacteroidetes bacterium]|nr:LytTR family transcriptional regulator DNA-binding domain-containing protein [Bacteroidota bacterium]